ncbi:MAG: beta-phosphoglucomutase family hydrolase [bacterium]
MPQRIRLAAGIGACLFDLDGVLTDTAEVHAAAWKQTFDAFLSERAAGSGEPLVPFDAAADYAAHVDGRPRADGVRAFLASRGISLPAGGPGDPPSDATVHGLANRKNELLGHLIERQGVRAYEDSLRFLEAVRAAGLGCAVVTSSENADAVLRAAGLDEFFDVQVDGVAVRELGLAGKPAPDGFLEAARRLRVAPARAAVFEDAVAGVAAGRAGDFGQVIGVDRVGHAAALREAGADVVVSDLAELLEAP